MSEAKPARRPGTVVLEEGRPLSESLIWELQRSFYRREGLAAWKPKAVPFYITSNAFVARAYARAVAGFLRDLAGGGGAHLDRAAPLYVVELAAGSGQFAYLFLRRLAELRAQIPALDGLDVRYVMTDFAESNVEAWERHERFAPFREQGTLDFARFDLEQDREIHLRRSGLVLDADTVANPMVVLANYAFDSTAQDAFQATDGVLQERMARVLSSRRERDLTDPELLQRIELRFALAPVRPARYDDPLLERVLERYRSGAARTSFLLPLGALRCMRAFRELSHDRLLVLTGDKSASRPEEMAHDRDPQLYVHAGGCFSFLFNLHALGLYFEEAGGVALLTQRRDQRLRVGAFLSSFPGVSLAETRLAFGQALEDFGPADYYSLVYGLRNEHPTTSLEVILAQMRLGGWDYELVFSWREELVKLAPAAPPWLQEELAEGLEHVWDEYYPMQRDLAFELARIFLAMKRPLQALRFCHESLRLAGPHYLTFLSVGFACVLLGREDEAIGWIQKSLESKPDNPAAVNLRARLLEKLSR
jgi:tetratricopeptide (TPR) repeat protein